MASHHPGSAAAPRLTPAGSIEIDWAQLLLPISSTQPSGPNLEYSPELAELELLARGTPDRRMGAALAPGQPPDHQAVLQRGLALLQRTKDVRVFVHVLAACLQTAGLATFVNGLGALRELLERFWDSLHPELDPDDEARATARANATMACASPELVRALRRAPSFGAANGAILCLDEAWQALRDAGGEGDAAAAAQRLLLDVRGQQHGAAAALTSSLRAGLAHVTALSAAFTERAVASPDLEPLQRFFQDGLAVLRQPRDAQPPEASERADEDDAPGENARAGAPPLASAHAEPRAASPSPRNSIHSRDDVLQALAQICAYYEAHEPASPVPLLLRRCQRLVGLDFIATLRELAPEALAKVALLGGSSGDTERSS